MGRHKKQSNEERLLKKRLAERKRQERIRNDPECLLQEKLKRHLKYKNQIKKGIVKPINKMSSREKRTQRKKWRENSMRYRQNRKLANKEVVADTPPSSNEENDATNLMIVSTPKPGPSSSRTNNDGRSSSGRKRVRKDRARAYQHIKELEHQLKTLKKSKEKYKQRYYRLKKSTSQKSTTSDDLTPRSKTEVLLKGAKVPNEVRKKLFFANVMESQLSQNYKNLRGAKNKQLFMKIISGKIIKKYKCLRMSRSFLKYKSFITNENRKNLFYERKIKHDVYEKKESIKRFLENDENSRLCPGKKDCITRKKIKMQKRFLNESLQTLHKKYLTENHSYKVSYSTFCRYKPFWIVEPNVQSRDTCLCITHENMKLITEKLYSYGVLNSKYPREVLMSMTCNSAMSDKCMLRKCKNCRQNKILFNSFVENDSVSYKKWIARKEIKNIRGTTKIIKLISKQIIETRMIEMISELKVTAPKYMIHLANVKHQTKALSDLKSRIEENGIVIHIDFSENYCCKYFSETQAMHFGASRQQISMHTGVYYYNENGNVVSKPFCSMSPSLRHDSAAMWAHLVPVLESILYHRRVERIDFFSDSPTSQYRNKTNFYLMAKILPSLYPNIKFSSWNFGESGHGKGAPDGVGGVLKRTADSIVAHGKDLSNFPDVFRVLKEACKGVELFEITNSNIMSVETKYLINQTLEVFKGTMKVHQALIDFNSPNTIIFRSLSCSCATTLRCEHGFDLGKKELKNDDAGNDDVLTKSSDHESNVSYDKLQPGDWVVVQYDGKLYPGEVLSSSSNMIKVNAMEHATENTYKWPRKADICIYSRNDIIKKIEPPEPCCNRASQFKFGGFP